MEVGAMADMHTVVATELYNAPRERGEQYGWAWDDGVTASLEAVVRAGDHHYFRQRGLPVDSDVVGSFSAALACGRDRRAERWKGSEAGLPAPAPGPASAGPAAGSVAAAGSEVAQQGADDGVRLLAVAEAVFGRFTDHVGDRSVSEEVVEVLAPVVGDVDSFGVRLNAFAEQYHQRLAQNYADYGPGSAHHVRQGRYVLVRQPESLIVWKLLSTFHGRFRLRNAWEHSDLPETMLTDLAAVWGVAL
ncbi:hypothetical protein C1N81_00470 (plasmid) [Streptomyces sp. SGAir0957]